MQSIENSVFNGLIIQLICFYLLLLISKIQ